MSVYDYSNVVEGLQHFNEASDAVRDDKDKEVGTVLVGLGVPVSVKASEKALKSVLKKYKNNAEYRVEQARQQVRDVVNEARDEPQPQPQQENIHGEQIEMQEIEPEPDLLQQIMDREQGQVGPEYDEYRAGNTQTTLRFAEPQQQQVDMNDMAPERRMNDDELRGPEAEGVDVAEEAGDAADALDAVALDTSWIPEVSAVIAVGGLVASATEGLIDLFSDPSRP